MRGTLNSQNPREVILFRLDKHLDRLLNSAKFLHYEIDKEYLRDQIFRFIHENKPKQDFYIRPLIYVSDLGISPRLHGVEKDLLIYGLPMGDYLDPSGINCRFSSWSRQADANFPGRGKISASYITSAMAKTEAIESGFDEALIFNAAGKISEASAMNVFVYRRGKLITPSVDQDILEGITRDSVIQLASQELGLEVEERPLDKSELLIADEVFLTGTAAKITPVKQIENYSLPEAKPVTQKLRDWLIQINTKQTDKYQDWLTTVKI
jgi:branched-chain amino acid aminotransferase